MDRKVQKYHYRQAERAMKTVIYHLEHIEDSSRFVDHMEGYLDDLQRMKRRELYHD